MSSQGTYLRYAGTKAHRQIGRAERQGSILKEMIAHTVQGRHVVGSQMMRMVVTECAFVKKKQSQPWRLFTKPMGLGTFA